MTVILSDYIGKKFSDLQKNPIFDGWVFEKSIDKDLHDPIVHYLCDERGIEIHCNEHNVISVIFLRPNNSGRVPHELHPELLFSASRDSVIGTLGQPTKSGKALNSSTLGRYGSWDSFTFKAFTVHVEYELSLKGVKQITYMSNGVVPE